MFDPFAFGALGSARPFGGGRASNGEELIWALAFLIFPLLTFVVVAFAIPGGAGNASELILYGLPIGFTAVTIWLSRLLRARAAWAVQSAVVCLLFCFAAAIAAGVLSIF
jgi:hypothetical protein